jgi:hypothetical protein
MSAVLDGFGEAAAPARRTIPFDYLFEFRLKGQPGEAISRTVSVSVEGPFVAAAIGYGVVPAAPVFRFGLDRRVLDGAIRNEAKLDPAAGRRELLAKVLASRGLVVPRVAPEAAAAPAPALGPAAVAIPAFAGVVPPIKKITLPNKAQISIEAQPPALPELSLRSIVESLSRKAIENPELQLAVESAAARPARRGTSPFALVEAVLRNGFRLNPELAEVVLLRLREESELSEEALEELWETVAAPPENIQFKYALYDEGTGRAFQSDPILNTAGLGISDGSRPFRTFAVPISFAPRTTIRMDVIEVSRYPGTLHVALHGYKVLGTSGTPTDLRRQARRGRRR